jgi:hypothetical protein
MRTETHFKFDLLGTDDVGVADHDQDVRLEGL